MCTLAEGIGIGIFEEHGAHHGFAVHCLSGYAVLVGEEHGLGLQVPAVQAGCLVAQYMGVFRVCPPSVHVEFHGSIGLPLEFTYIYGNVLPAENAVDVGGDVRLSRESGADEGGDVEADVFPVAARLVAAPDAGIALCAGPPVETDDEGSGIAAVVGHDFAHIGHTVQSKRVAPSNPCHVGLEHAYACVADFLDNVALEEGGDALLGMKIALCPQADFHTFGAGIVAEGFEVLDVSVERGGLSVACTVTIVGEEPSERHVVVEITVYGSACRPLVVGLLSVGTGEFAVQRLAYAAVVLLAFVVGLAVFVGHESRLALCCRCPVVAVIGVEMSFVEAELGKQYGISS